MDNPNGEKIEDIIKKINSASDKKGSEPAKKGGLVFEFVRLDEEPVNEAAEEIGEKASVPSEPAAVESEFTLPDVFEVNEKYNTPLSPLDADGATKIWTTYVPRFTEASENYKMAATPRPDKPIYRPRTEEQSTEGLDPTAEIEAELDNTVIVEMDKESVGEEIEESISVYKFSDDGEEPEDKMCVRTVADERAEIDSLLAKEEPSVEEEAVPEEEEPEEAVVQEPEEPTVYTIPDPDGEEMEVLDYTKKATAQESAPGGVSTAVPDVKKKLLTEFTLPMQRDRFKDGFLDRLMSIKIRAVAAAVFALVLLIFESLYCFGALEDKLFSLPITPLVPVVIDYLLCVAVFAVALPEIVRAFAYCVKKKPLPELMIPACFVALTLYFVAAVCSPVKESYAFFGFIFSVFPVSAILASYYRTEADFTAFKEISKTGEKQILDKKKTRELGEENIALDGIIDEYKSESARFFRASFITDFFKRTRMTPEKPMRTAVLLAVPFGVALVVGAVAFFLIDGIVSAMAVFSFVALLASPVFAVLSYKVAYSDSQKAAFEEESAAVGEIAFDNFSAVDVIAFDDTEIFGPDDVNLKRFMLYGDRDNMEKAMRQMCSLFSVTGGPLNYIFAGALDNRVRHAPAGNPVIEHDGISGDVGNSRICAGSEEYMLRHGIAIPEGAVSYERGIDTTKIMYAAENGEVHAKFYIRYSFSEEFTMLLPSLKEEGIVPLVYTRDPNISNELLKTLSAGADSMRVMKRFTPKEGEDKLYSRVSADIVSDGEKINAISTVIVAKKYKKLLDRLATNELYAMAAGGVLAILLTVFDMIAVSGIIFGFWQIAWCIVLYFVSRKTLLADKILDKKSRKKDADK